MLIVALRYYSNEKLLRHSYFQTPPGKEVLPLSWKLLFRELEIRWEQKDIEFQEGCLYKEKKIELGGYLSVNSVREFEDELIINNT